MFCLWKVCSLGQVSIFVGVRVLGHVRSFVGSNLLKEMASVSVNMTYSHHQNGPKVSRRFLCHPGTISVSVVFKKRTCNHTPHTHTHNDLRILRACWFLPNLSQSSVDLFLQLQTSTAKDVGFLGIQNSDQSRVGRIQILNAFHGSLDPCSHPSEPVPWNAFGPRKPSGGGLGGLLSNTTKSTVKPVRISAFSGVENGGKPGCVSHDTHGCEAVREELYWCLYNSSLLLVRTEPQKAFFGSDPPAKGLIGHRFLLFLDTF